MKRILSLTIWLVFLAWATSFSQSNNVDTTVIGVDYFSQTMTASIDTLDIIFDLKPRPNFYAIAVACSTGADTITVWVQQRDGSTWVQTALIDISDNTSDASMICSTTQKTWILLHPQPKKVRLVSTSDDASSDYVVVQGLYGVLGR
jgi:hypothetical protein